MRNYITHDECNKCMSRKNWYLDSVKSLFLYRDSGRELIINLKKNSNNYIYNVLTTLIINNNKDFFNEIDIIIPVPLHWITKLLRGFNQSVLIGENLSLQAMIPVKKNILYKKINTQSQHRILFQDRFTNIKNSFIIKNHCVIENKNILLIDDVITTGATSNECARLLKLFNAKSVKLITIARTIL